MLYLSPAVETQLSLRASDKQQSKQGCFMRQLEANLSHLNKYINRYRTAFSF